MVKVKRALRSPYQKYGKSPQVYSTAYQLWREEVLKGGAGSPKALALACQHAKYVGVKHNDAEGNFANDCI